MKKVIIIGATSGIGKELASQYVQRGWKVGITGRRKELLDERKKQEPENVFTACIDVQGDENILRVKALIQELNGMDLFIYNAGVGDISSRLDWEIEKKTYQTNVKGFIELAHFAFNYFIEKGEGQIAVISSIASIRGNSFAPAYSASKAFASNYCEGLSLKAKRLKKNVVITDIQPGFVATAMAKGKGRFWEAPVAKAVRQIISAISQKRRRVYITRRWALVAWIMKWVPWFVYKRIG